MQNPIHQMKGNDTVVYMFVGLFFSFVYIAFVLAFEKNQERNEQQQQREYVIIE